MGHFLANKRQTRILASLLLVVQRPNESLRSYIKRFIVAFANVKDSNKSFAIQAFRIGLINEHLYYAFCNNSITNMHGLISKAQALAEVEEIMTSHTG